jgi:UDPglucose 6-dehydrogenase
MLFITNNEAEMAKMFRNTFLATKVSLCNEFAQFCTLKGIDYENVRVAATDDDRIGASHTAVPGPDGRKGFGGTCFPKDIGSMVYEMKRSGMRPHILEAVQTRNIEVDRPEKDWEVDHGRAVM